MNSLPVLAVDQICSHLRPEDLKSVRLTCRGFEAPAARLLFTELHLSGSEQQCDYDRLDYGRKRFAEYGQLDTVVSDLLPVAPHVRKLVFRPAFYYQDLWTRIERGREATRHMVRSPWADCDLDEATWQKMMADQTAATEAAVVEALTNMFSRMKALRCVEIAPPTFSSSTFGAFAMEWRLGRYNPFECEKVGPYLRVISQALTQADHHIKELHVHSIAWQSLEETPSLCSITGGLEVLELDVQDYVHIYDHQAIPQVRKLLHMSIPTLRSLTIRCSAFGQHPERGVHSLAKLLFEEDEIRPLVFPRLTAFRLGSVIVSPNQLRDFVAAQPSLALLDTRHVYLGLLGIDWFDVEAALPTTVKEWNLSWVGHGPFAGFPPPISYNWIRKWEPYGDDRFRALGWKHDPAPDGVLYRRK